MTITTSDICDPFSQPLRIYIPQYYIWFKKTFFQELRIDQVMGRGCTTILRSFYWCLNDLDVLLHFLVIWYIGEYGMWLKKIIKWAVFEKFQKLALVLLTSRDQLRNDLLSFVCQIILLHESCIYIFFHIYT